MTGAMKYDSLRAKMVRQRGNCYVATEALWHVLGCRDSWWVPCVLRLRSETHWFLRHKVSREVIDPSRRQFMGRLPDYSKGRPCPFLTREPSRRARALMETLTWQPENRRRKSRSRSSTRS